MAFWFDGPVAAENRAAVVRVQEGARRIFPVAFRCLVPVDGRTVNGRIQSVESSETCRRTGHARPRSLDARPARRRGVGTREKRTAQPAGRDDRQFSLGRAAGHRDHRRRLAPRECSCRRRASPARDQFCGSPSTFREAQARAARVGRPQRRQDDVDASNGFGASHGRVADYENLFRNATSRSDGA